MSAADTYARLPDAVTDVFGEEATAAYAYDLLTVDVPAASWIAALETARSALGCSYFDWLSAVDEPGTGFRVCAHVAALGEGTVRRLLLRTTVPHESPALPSAVGVYAGAAWHERETYEMFGIGFEDHPHLVPLLLPEGFEGHPLRKDFVLAARVAKAWPGAKEPGESEHGGPKRRTMLPPGVPDPNEWGPLKGQLPPAPARPARGARAAGAAGDRPVRRARSASEGSAAQRPDATETPQAAPPRRTRSVSQGSASQAAGPAPTPPAGPADAGTARSGGDAARGTGAAGGADAPWHDARPAFGDTPEQQAPERPEPPAEPASSQEAAQAEPGSAQEPAPAPVPEPEQPSEPASAPEAEQRSEPASPDASAQGDADGDRKSAPEPGREPEPDRDSSSGTDRADRNNRTDRPDGPDGPDRPAGGDAA
ncbi:NADH-quinone oxidoreductase subunit C [Streptomyces sp. B1I3]|uniref:NADH-quinone oxidoreductase subunit C n=1 Tax=Streptomyces sp. B1I3 TaxID=3042264 RepID=UPI002781BC0A|nr:NADH-quinone oxidoreductase subunit C [Streptomyces sp. B1I3]MDQ0794628.1 NADH:ubiquinone oxidoreductase subunit C [Streptomyces sp. B1I3]